jgi:hypothetical protein
MLEQSRACVHRLALYISSAVRLHWARNARSRRGPGVRQDRVLPVRPGLWQAACSVPAWAPRALNTIQDLPPACIAAGSSSLGVAERRSGLVGCEMGTQTQKGIRCRQSKAVLLPPLFLILRSPAPAGTPQAILPRSGAPSAAIFACKQIPPCKLASTFSCPLCAHRRAHVRSPTPPDSAHRPLVRSPPRSCHKPQRSRAFKGVLHLLRAWVVGVGCWAAVAHPRGFTG